VDLSPEALALAGENGERTGLALRLVLGDLCSAIAPGSLDAVVANPPYLTELEYDTLDGSVREWEPRLALPSGTDGLEATGRLVQQAYGAVRAGGWLALEADGVRATDAARLAARAGWSDVSIHQDLFGRARFVVARRSEAA
jgi:release factor glutamine methyltransferase